MKKRFSALSLLLILVISLCSCSLLPNAGGEGNEGEDEFIYDSLSELYLIVSPKTSGALSASLSGALDSVREGIVKFAPTDSEPHSHEIVLGNTEREISLIALERLARLDKENADDRSFLIYSDGKSVAIVYEEDEEGITASLAVDYFIKNYVKSTLVCENGTVFAKTVNILDDYYGKMDEEYFASAWEKFEQSAGKELTDSFKRLYSLYTPDMLSWMANLYDPDICVCMDYYGESECKNTKYCGTAAFYFSNSARNTVGFLPDVESTNQTLNFLSSSGIGYRYGDNYADFLPEEMLEKIGDFVIALQEPNGYFYHPQWGIEFTDGKVSRRSRDLNWSESILTHLGRKPVYDTPNGMKGTGVAPTSSRTALTGGGAASAVSKVLAASADSYDPNLQDLASFMAYLEGLDIRERSYHVGNDLTSQASQIVARDRVIGTSEDPTPLMDYLILWLNENQNPETGHWDYKKPGDRDYDPYYGVNGLLKIGGIYTAAKRVMPYSAEAAKSAMAAITEPTEIDAVVDLYNTWFSIRNILENLRKCGGAEEFALADSIVRELRADASGAVDVSRSKIAAFKKNDGSFSYTPNYSSSHAQGCPAAVPNSVEGDVNGNNIASTGIITYALSALDLLALKVPMFGERDRRAFLKEIDELSPISKVEDAIVPEPLTFDYDKIGIPSEDTEVETFGGSVKVVKDPTGKGSGNVVEILSHTGGGDKLTVKNATNSSLAKTAVFEGDFCIAESDVEYSVQLLLKDIYMLAFKVIDGKVHVREVSSSTSANGTEEELGIVADLGEWFSLKVEYYPGDQDSVRIKVYADTDLSDGRELKLFAVSDNYFDQDGTKYLSAAGKPSSSYKGAELYVMSKPNLKMYVDNLNCYNVKSTYSPITDPNSQPFFNIDAPDRAENKYTFEDGIPEEIITSEEGILTENGALVMDSYSANPTVLFPMTVRTAGAKCGSVSLDLTVKEMENGAKLLLVGKDGGERIFGISLVKGADGIAIATEGKDKSTVFGDFTVALDSKVNLKLEYYHREDRVFVYLDGRFVGESKNLFADGYKRTMDSLSVSTSGKAQILLDNVTVEKTKKSFEDATKPIVDPVIWSFDTEEGIALSGSGAGWVSEAGDGMISLDSKRGKVSLSVPVNNRATLYTAASFEAEISVKGASSGITHYVRLLTKDGAEIAALALMKNGSRLELCQVGPDGAITEPIYSYLSSERVKLSFEIFAENRMIHIYNNGTAVAKTSIFSGEQFAGQDYGFAVIESGESGSEALVDDVRFETLYKIYSNVKVNAKENPENSTKTPITFEHSSSGNLPSVIGGALAGTSSQMRVDRVKKGEGYTNALAFRTVVGANDFLTFTTSEDLSTSSAVVFEADIFLDINTTDDTTCYQMYFSKRDSVDRAYMLQLARSGDGFTLVDKSDFNNDGATRTRVLKSGIKGGEWIRLKVEYFRGDRSNVRFRISLNGETVAVSDNFFGSQNAAAAPNFAVECFYFYTLNKCDGTLYLDNVSLYGNNGSCNDELCFEK